MWPGVCLRGFQASEHIGTRWLYIGNAIGNGYPSHMKNPEFVIDGPLNIPSMKGYVSLYEGTVTIKKAEGGENYFTFEIDGEDVLHHSITGTWTGPAVLGRNGHPGSLLGQGVRHDTGRKKPRPFRSRRAAASRQPRELKVAACPDAATGRAGNVPVKTADIHPKSAGVHPAPALFSHQ